MTSSIIHLNQVFYSAGEHRILHNVSTELSAPRTAVIGANGSGKSTFARLLNGLLQPDTGLVQVNGLNTHSDARAVRRQVGFVFQNPDLQFVMPTVREDLAFGLRNMAVPRDEIEHRVEQILSRFKLTHLRDRTVHTLSGGEKQLLCIAAVLIMQPAIIVFDEPTTLLDLANRRHINRVIHSLAQQTIVVTHDLDFACQCDFALMFENGRLYDSGEPKRVVMAYRDRVDQQ